MHGASAIVGYRVRDIFVGGYRAGHLREQHMADGEDSVSDHLLRVAILGEIAKACTALGVLTLGDPSRLAEMTANQIYDALEEHDAPIELLGTVSSWGDTLNDQIVLHDLRMFNERGTIFDEVSNAVDP
jgi:hypothetical protein